MISCRLGREPLLNRPDGDNQVGELDRKKLASAFKPKPCQCWSAPTDSVQAPQQVANKRGHGDVPVLLPVTIAARPERSVLFGGYRILARNWFLMKTLGKNGVVRGGKSLDPGMVV